MQVYNTLTKKKETFRPIKNKHVNLFVCGPTVYDYAHLGHARTYIAFDIIAKYLKEKNYNVFYLQNITNLDDKIIKRAQEKNLTPQKLAQQFEKAYMQDMQSLGINSVNQYARATDYIKEIINQTTYLLEKGYAYQIKDGIYFDITKFKEYGKLSKRTIQQAEDATSRVDEAKEKRNKGDFCLWKTSKKGEPAWPAPFSAGRPGWHIEDTAITEKHFGAQYDIHGGARDLIFPHHEAEIAQMEAISGKKPLVKYWLHTGFLTVNGRKMSKSLNNFVTIQDFLKENSARLLRLFIVKTHYRSPVDYTSKAITQTKKELAKVDEFIDNLKSKSIKTKKTTLIKIAAYQKELDQAMADDFNTAKAIATIFKLINKTNTLINQNQLSATEANNILKFLKKIDRVFGFIFTKNITPKIPNEIITLVKTREAYRKKGNWQKADQIRKEINKLGYKVADTPTKPLIKRT